ncbi:MAG: SDR family NAD(P)-dependent oxidoreductase, partial [Propionibacteriaceae bacterium]|nr:SDR family NAD(P)-dependent oxidoreductase [Propionibacteriaceae bacterium]
MPSTTRSTDYSQRFAGKTAIVTGAGSGIGLATAKMIIEDGGTVVAVDLDQDRLGQAQTQLGEAYLPLD